MKIAQTICGGLDYKDAELSILITDDEGIRSLNKDWRSKDKATDVLSFSQVESLDGDWPEFPGMGGDEELSATPVLGDVVISAETAFRQAEAADVSLESEFRRLLVHGALHLLGHDHVHGGRQAAKMRREEERLLSLLEEELGRA